MPFEKAKRRGTATLWCALLVSLVAIPSAFPLLQYWSTRGLLFYTNAYDEAMYLSYDGARTTVGLSRLSEYVILALHRVGISGGYINFVSDLLFPIVTIVLLRRLAQRFSFSTVESVVLPFIVMTLPLAFGYSDPWYGQWYDKWHYGSSSLRWLTLPQAYYPPFFRTPEPQFSLAVLAIATYLAVRLGSYAIALAVVPFVYPFVGVPYAFVVLSLLVASRSEHLVQSAFLRALAGAGIAYVVIAAGLFAYYQVLLKGTFQGEFLLKTHRPLISGTGMLALLVFVVAHRRLPSHFKVPALLLALAPVAAANTQVIAGFVMQPNNFEQYFGVIAVGLLCAMLVHSIKCNHLLLGAGVVLGSVLLFAYSRQTFSKNSSIWLRMPPSHGLRAALRSAPESLVMDDSDLADVFVLMEPQLHFSALSRAQTYWAGANLMSERFRSYQCTKQLLSLYGRGAVSDKTLSSLDRSFRYLNTDFPLATLGRTDVSRQMFDPSAPPGACPSRALQMFPWLELGPTLPDDALRARLDESFRLNNRVAERGFTTPSQQWSDAGRAVFRIDESRVMDVRVTSRIDRGCVGVGVVGTDHMSYETEAQLVVNGSAQTVDLVFPARRDDSYSFVVRNCSANGSSSGAVEAVHVFPVTGASVAPL